MTSLAHQLKRLALPQNDSNLLSQRVVASVLFDPKDAASMDRSTFYALGCTGLEELMGIDLAFSEFQETLFSQASLTLERSVQSKEVNKKLDKSISLFLTRLSPYFLLKPALKCIEWLIHRFHIQLYNQDSLIACVLPYHETKVFVRVIQLLKIEDPTHKWHWLHGLQKPGVPLARGTLLTHCYKDLGFMDFICSMVTDSVKVKHPGWLRVIFSFYASTIVSALDAVEKITNSIIAKLLPFVQLGLKSNLLDYVAATYMIVCQMAVKVVMEAQLVDSLTVQLCKSLSRMPQLSREGLSCIIVLLQNQKEGIVGPKAFGYLCAIPTLVSTLQSIATVHDISPLLRYLLPHLIHSVMTQDGWFLSVFCINLQWHLFSEYKCTSYIELSSDRISSVLFLVFILECFFILFYLLFYRYPCALDVALENHVKKMSSDHEKTVLHQFISLTMSCGKYQILPDSDTSLMLSLNHPLASVRNMAVDYLKEILTSEHNGFDEAFLKDALLERIKDDMPEIVLSALKALQLYLTFSLCRCSVLKEAVRVLDDPRIIEGNPDLKAQISWEILPFLVLTNAAPKCVELQMASCVAETTLLSQHPLTHGWAKGKHSCCFTCLLIFEKRNLILTRLCFSDEPWWNPEKMDANTCCYVHLLCRLFDVVISGASQGPLALCFKSLMQPLLQVHLNEPTTLFKFLSLLWGYNSNLGDQLDCQVSAILQTQALYVGKALLCNQPIKTRNVLASGSSPVVPSLLVCLCSGVCEVRRAAIAVLHSLSGVVSSPYYLLVENVLKSSDEIIADPSYLSQALSKMYEEELLLKDKKKKLASIEQLLQCVQLPCCPAYTCKTLLRALQDPVLAILLPAVERLLEQCAPDSCTFLPDEAHLLQLLLSKFNEASAPLLVKDPRCLEVFIRALGTSAKPYPSMPSFQIIALEQITKPFFNALGDEKIQQKILSVLFDLLVGNKNPACAQAINSVFKAIAVDAELVANELMPVEKQKVTATVQQARRSKIQTRKTQDTSRAVSEENVVSWPRVTLILELLQHKKKLRRAECLVPALFNLLSRCLEPAAAEQENLEYTKQLILSCLLNVCQKLSPDGGPISKDVLEEDKFNVELVVQCVRMSDMPQTHHHALLLLGALAGIFPEKVLHNIMPIFTFMGSNIMRLDDTYSFQVINKTVQAVIPALIKANEGGSAQSEGNMETVVSHIVHVFVDALPHVPEHRRLPILSQLMNTLGPSRFLWVLMLLLFKQHVTQTSVSATGAEKEAVVERDQDFWISVCCEFEVKEQLTSIIRILQYLMTLPQDKEEGKNCPLHAVKKEETVSDVIFSVEANSGKDLRHFKFLSISFMAQLLASDRFVGKVADCEDITESTLQTLLEEVLRYIHAVARCVEDNADKPTAKFWRALLSKSYDILDKVNALLPMDSFIMVMRGLMGNQLASVRRKAMELLNNKLQQRTQWITVLLELIGVLLKIVGRRHGQVTAQEEEELAINRQTALYSLKLLCRNFGSGHQEPFVPVLKKAVELVADKDEEKNVMGSALLCVAEVTSTLKALAIPQLHSLMPAVLDTLKERKDLLNNEIYLLSAVTALQRVSETLPHFISPYLEDTISQVCITKRLTSCPQLSVRLSSLSTTLATKVPPRVLIPTITKCHCNRLGPLMIILKEHITHMEKDQLNNHQSELTSFFLSALDFRAQHCQGDLKKTGEIEGCVIDCLLVMVMKLSEVTFRPLFFKLFDWSKMDGASKNRLLTFYRLADSIANKLKGLFVLFAGQLVKPISELLRQLNISHTDNVTKSSLLLQYVLDCLHKIFLYDTQRFLSKERADALLGPLVDQLENMLGGDEIYKTHITKHLVPCIAQFAVAMGDDSQWKVLNYQILLKTRHSSPKVRFSALVMLLELASKLRENYMVLLPETIPFLAELMEDECEEVEQQVQKVIHEMETILGEPLQSYF
uniref:HEAT repeat-containing protein 1 n=1 Tax=Cyprinus carpio TaxID=7962 RepID=A0A8C1WDZ0_CYPCA